ncbi:hypothetical protein EC988_001565 [Linderina pennispora]|nr:hypothetical protein EC988_001565 [Linderina pennispora]
MVDPTFASLAFPELQSDHVHPLIGGEAKARLVARLHELGTTQAYRMLGSILKRDPDDVPQDEFWAHTRQSVASGQSVWESDVDFIVVLTTFPGLGSSVMTEVRVAINSCEEASGETIAALTAFFNDFRVLSPEPVFVMGIDEYLYRELPLTCEDESICDGYSMGIEEWRGLSRPVPFDQSPVAQELGLELSQMTADDLGVVGESSKINYPREYLEYLLPCSVCIRRKSDQQIVAWGMAHRDYQLGLMFTIDAYRRKGLAKHILFALGDRIVDTFMERMRITDGPFTLSLAIEAYNEQSRRLFGGVGFVPTSRIMWGVM